MVKRTKNRKKHFRKKTDIGLFGTQIDPTLVFNNEYRDFINLSEAEVESKFQDTLACLREEFLRSDPLSILGCLAVYGMSAGIHKDGTIKKYGPEIMQSNIELLQAILLSIPTDKISHEQIHPNVVQNFFNKLPILSKAFQIKRFQKTMHFPQDKVQITRLQEVLRAHTQYVRNWGFLDDVIDITTKISEKFDFEFKEIYKFSFLTAIKVFKFIINDFEDLLNKRRENILLLFKAKDIKTAIKSFYIATEIDENYEEFYKYAIENCLKLDEVQKILLYYYDSCIGKSFILNPRELSQKTNVALDEILYIFNTFSLPLGCLERCDPESFFLDNPVWSKPLIKLGEGIFFYGAPTTFFSFILKILNGLCKEDENLKRKLVQARANFLEDHIEILFKAAFPETQSVRGFKWIEDNNNYENDFLIKVDSSLFIIEAKSHEITWPALRGAEDRIKRHIQETIYAPSIQSKRLEDKLWQYQAGIISLDGFPFNITDIKSICRLSVTLDDFATLQTMAYQFKSIGWIPVNHQIAPCILYSDIKVIFDMLDNKFHKINYLKRRAVLPEALSYIGDEIDLLGLYLVCGFNTHSEQIDKAAYLILTGMSKLIEDYYAALESKTVKPNKPKPKLTKFWSSICEKLEKSSITRWSEAVSMLLTLSFQEQEALEKYYKTIIKNVKNDHKILGDVDAAIFSSAYHKEIAMALYAFRNKDIVNCYEKMENIAGQIFENTEIKRCLVIAQNIDDSRDFVYSTLAVYFR